MGIHARHDPYRHYDDETRRHYKKDSQFLADLYTITYINHSDDGETHRTTVDAKVSYSINNSCSIKVLV